MAMATQRLYAGRPPSGGRFVGGIDCWNVWLRYNGNHWVTVKLTLRRPKRGPKGNFWLGWNGERFAKNLDYATLQAHYPDLLHPLKVLIQSLPSPRSLLSG